MSKVKRAVFQGLVPLPPPKGLGYESFDLSWVVEAAGKLVVVYNAQTNTTEINTQSADGDVSRLISELRLYGYKQIE